MRQRPYRLAVAIVLTAALALGALGRTVYRTVIHPTYDRGGLLTLLVVGSDSGPPNRTGDPMRGRADAIHLVAVDTGRRRVTVVDIPRDAVVGGTKVNAHLAIGGPDALVSQLEAFTGVDIDHWILTSFAGFNELTAAVGAVEVHAEVPMHDPSSGSDFDLGPVRVQGATALAYARDRHSLPDGDFGRTRHQGDLLVALHQRAIDQQLDLGAIARLVATVARTTVSDVPTGDLLPLALLALDIDPVDVFHVALTGSVATLDGASVVYLAPTNVFDRIAAGDIGPARPEGR